MSARLSALVLAACTSALAAGEPAKPAPTALDVAEVRLIRALETQSWVAWKEQDAEFFASFLSDDHVEVQAHGIGGKAGVVAGVRAKVCAVKSYRLGPITLTALSERIVLANYRAEQETTCGPARVPSPAWVSSIYAKRDGRWVNVLYQHTPITSKED
jgi:hypothetical protein